MGEDSAVALDTGATADPFCLKWLGNLTCFWRNGGYAGYRPLQRVRVLNSAMGAMERRVLLQILRLTLGRLRRKWIPRQCYEKVPRRHRGGQSDFGSAVLTIRNHDEESPLKVNGMGHYGLSVVSFGGEPAELLRGPKLMAPYLYWAFADKRPDV